jgi:hypothetical protein
MTWRRQGRMLCTVTGASWRGCRWISKPRGLPSWAESLGIALLLVVLVGAHFLSSKAANRSVNGAGFVASINGAFDDVKLMLAFVLVLGPTLNRPKRK